MPERASRGRNKESGTPEPSIEEVFKEFQELIHKQGGEQEGLDPKDLARLKARSERLKKGEYDGVRGGVLFLRFLNFKLQKLLENEDKKNVSPQGVKKIINKIKKGRKEKDAQTQPPNTEVRIPTLKYEDARRIYIRLMYDFKRGELQQKYNSEDGQIRWLMRNGYKDVNLGQFWTIIPEDVRKAMSSNWRKMSMPLQQAIEIRKELIEQLENRTLEREYDSEDGQIRWLMRNGYKDVNLEQFWTIIPEDVRKAMSSNWRKMSMPLQQAIEIRKELNKLLEDRALKEKYNSADGQIRWLMRNGYKDVNLEQFWSIIPENVRNAMKKWGKMSMPLQKAIEIRKELNKLLEDRTLKEKYNSADGQIRWLMRNGYKDVHLGQFWSIIPENVRKAMDWKYINMPSGVARLFVKNAKRNEELITQMLDEHIGQHEERLIKSMARQLAHLYPYEEGEEEKIKEMLRKINGAYHDFTDVIRAITEEDIENIGNIDETALYEVLYSACKEKLDLEPLGVIFLLRLHGRNIASVRTLIKTGSWPERSYEPTHSNWDEDGQANLIDRVADPNSGKANEMTEIRLSFKKLKEYLPDDTSNRIKDVLERFLDEEELEPEENEYLAEFIREHPHLMELLIL